MNGIKLEKIIVALMSLVFNKVLLIWLINASNIFAMLAIFTLFAVNFTVLIKSFDQVIDIFESLRKKPVTQYSVPCVQDEGNDEVTSSS